MNELNLEYKIIGKDKLILELSKLSYQGRLVVAENSDHEVYLDRPDIIINNLKTLI